MEQKETRVLAEENPEWLNTPSPFDQLDEDWIRIIIFYVFHSPAGSVSARGTTLPNYGWGTKNGSQDFKLLKKRMIEYAGMKPEDFQCIKKWEDARNSFEANNLIDFPKNISKERATFFVGGYPTCETVMRHLRNSFAHGRLSFYEEKGKIYIAMEDIARQKAISARMILSKTTLFRWMIITIAGPISDEELETMLQIEIAPGTEQLTDSEKDEATTSLPA